MKLSNSELKNNYALENGGAIYAAYSSYITIVSTNFYYNVAYTKGSQLYVAYLETSELLTLTNVKFKSKTFYNSIYVLRSKSSISSTIFSASEGKYSLTQVPTYGQAIYCDECLKTTIKDS